MELFKVATIEEVKRIIVDNFMPLRETERINLKEADGRILAEDALALCNVPGFRRSTVDGYAVRAQDVAGASEAIPAILELTAEVLMGKAPQEKIQSLGECIYIPTGAMLPQGADSVVMLEYTDKLDDKTILCTSPIAPGENVVEEDEDVKQGEVAIQAGTKLRAYEIGILSALGFSEIEVFRKLRIGIISTGDEIVDCSITPQPGQIRDVNTYLLNALAVESGAQPIIYGVVNDDFAALMHKVETAYTECDVVLISGGSSVGKKDQTLKVIEGLANSQVLIHGLAVKPGKPTIMAKADKKIIFGLPGHPLACAVIFKILVTFYLDYATRYNNTYYPLMCKFSSNYHKAKGREEYLPVALEHVGEDIVAKPIFAKSGIMSGFSRAWGFIRIEKNLEGLKQGQKVAVFKF